MNFIGWMDVGWMDGCWMVGESGIKANSAQFSWSLAELGNNDVQLRGEVQTRERDDRS